MEEVLKKLVEKVKKDERVLSVILFGSYLTSDSPRDIDVCLVTKEMDELEMSKLKVEYLSEFPQLDISVFHQLPLYIRVRVLEGKVLFARDEDALYDVAIKTIKEWEDFRHVYEEYLKGVLNG